MLAADPAAVIALRATPGATDAVVWLDVVPFGAARLVVIDGAVPNHLGVEGLDFHVLLPPCVDFVRGPVTGLLWRTNLEERIGAWPDGIGSAEMGEAALLLAGGAGVTPRRHFSRRETHGPLARACTPAARRLARTEGFVTLRRGGRSVSADGKGVACESTRPNARVGGMRVELIRAGKPTGVGVRRVYQFRQPPTSAFGAGAFRLTQRPFVERCAVGVTVGPVGSGRFGRCDGAYKLRRLMYEEIARRKAE